VVAIGERHGTDHHGLGVNQPRSAGGGLNGSASGNALHDACVVP
jgi:hypothetical protein